MSPLHRTKQRVSISSHSISVRFHKEGSHLFLVCLHGVFTLSCLPNDLCPKTIFTHAVQSPRSIHVSSDQQKAMTMLTPWMWAFRIALVQNILVFNDTHLPLSLARQYQSQDHTEIQCGDNCIVLGISPQRYHDYQKQLEQSNGLPTLFWTCTHIANAFWDVLVDNTSWHELSRQQVCKDLIREEIIANGATFHQGDNSFALKQFLLHYVSSCFCNQLD